MYKLLRLTLLSLPLAGGVAWAQASPMNAPAGVNPTVGAGSADTRTPTQKRAGAVDTGAGSAAVPGDSGKPSGIPQTAPMSDRAGLPDSTTEKSTTTTTTKHKTLHRSTSDSDIPSSESKSVPGASDKSDLSKDLDSSDK